MGIKDEARKIFNKKMWKNLFCDFKKYYSKKEICKKLDDFAKRLKK